MITLAATLDIHLKNKLMKTVIYTANTEPLDNEGLFMDLYEKLPAWRREKVDKVKSREDKKRSLAAGLLLTQMGTVLCKQRAVPTDIGYEKNGKPYFTDRPDLHFNLSHSGKWAVCAFSDAPVGVDVEVRRDTTNLKVAERFFSKKENEYINSFDTKEQREDAFYKIWTLKEAFIKATGEGLSRPLNEFSFTFTPSGITIDIDTEYYFESITKGELYIGVAYWKPNQRDGFTGVQNCTPENPSLWLEEVNLSDL